ncbi:MAG: Cna B-type domain-containing protein [Lachnospiraceae bacterium]|nr:Cna B-type domain-containing protein [Lachnospiraceae bacterium]
MKKRICFRRALSGILSVVSVLSAVASPLTAYAAETAEPAAYEAEYPELDEVKDQLAADEIVTAIDIMVEYGSDFDAENDFEGIEYDSGKVKVTLHEAKSDSGQTYSSGHADTYKAVYYVEPYSGNPSYQISRTITVKEPETGIAVAASEDGGSGEDDSGGDADADPDPAAEVSETESEVVPVGEVTVESSVEEAAESEQVSSEAETTAEIDEATAAETESESDTEMNAETETETEEGTEEAISLMSLAEDTDNTSYVDGLSVIDIVDGTAPFDDDDEAGDDSNEDNRIVRSFDYVSYTISYTTALTDANVSVDSGVLYVEFTLPCSPDVAIFNMDAMNWMVDPVLTYYFEDGTTGTSYEDASTVVKQVLTRCRELTNAEFMTIPGAGTLSVGLYVGAASNGTMIQPEFTLWMVGNADEQKVSVSPEVITVSAAAKFAVKISQSSEMDIYGEYDLATGGENAAQDTVSGASTIRGRMESYGVTVMMQNDSVEKGLKGLEFPTGEITFDITLNEYSMNSAGVLLSNQSGYTPVMWDYDENERSSSTGEWGRTFVKQNGYAYSAAPYNVLGCYSLSSIYDSCYDGGDWTITQDEENPLVYHVTIKNYAVDTEDYIFPTANNTWYKRTEDGTTYKANQACISAGVIQVVLQFPYGDVDEITNVYFKVTADNFAVESDVYDTTASFAGTYVLLPPGSINVGVNFTTTSASSHSQQPDATYQLGSSYSSGDAYSYVGSSVRLWQKLTTSSDESIETVIGLIKWDADAFEVDRSSNYYSTAGLATGSVTINSYTGYFVGRSSNWSSEQEMSDTLMNDASLHYYRDLDALEADGYVCVGVLWVADCSYTANGTPFPQYLIDLVVKDTATVGETYAAVSEGWASYSDIDPMSAASGSAEYTMDTDQIEAYDLYKAYCSSSAYAAMGKKSSTDAYYVKTEYDSEGNIISGTHVTGFYGGTSLLICGETATVDISIADTGSNGQAKAVYDMDAGERTVSYSIQPYIEVDGNSSTGSEATAGTTTATVTVTLPSDLTYDAGSSMWGDDYITPEIEAAEDGTTTLTYTLADVTVGAALDAITFSCTIGHAGTMNDVTNNQSITVSAAIASTGDNRVKQAAFGNYSSTSLVIVKLVAISISKQVDAHLIEQDGEFTWTFLFANESEADQKGTRLADILPVSGDSMGSDFSGSYSVKSITIDFSSAVSSFEKDIDSMAFYVTDGSVSASASDLVTGVANISSWTDLMKNATVNDTNHTVTLDVSGYGDMTAFYFDLGTLSSKENISFDVTVSTEGNNPGDVYCNMFYEYGDDQSSSVTSVLVSTHVAERDISGLAWLDADGDGVRDDEETLLSGVTATLYRTTSSGYASSAKAAATVNGVKLYTAYDVYGESVDSVKTGKDGSYNFNNLEAGTYYVVFTGLDGYGLTVQDAGSDDAVDSDAAATVSEDGSGLENAYIAGITLPGLSEMDAYLYESSHNDIGLLTFTSGLTIRKVEADTDVTLSDAVFVMQDADGKYLTFENGSYTGVRNKVNESCYLTTGEDGTVSLSGLPLGTYVLSEYKAPDGYLKTDETWTVEVKSRSTDGSWISYVIVDGEILDGSLTVENEPDITTVTVTKAWKDNDDQDGLRSDVTLNLVGTITNDAGETVTVVTRSATIRSGSESWTYRFAALPVYSSGKVVSYSVTEEAVDGYTVSYSAMDGSWESGYSIVITNTHTPETTEYTVVKVWDDDENRDGVRPESIEVKLIGSDGSERVAKIAADDNWQYTFTDLPVYWNEGQEISYSVVESPVSGYVRSVVDANEEHEFVITNTHEIETVDIPVEKIWDDNDDQDGVRAEGITVVLTGSDGMVREAVLTAESDWKYTFSDLPVYWNEGALITYSLQEKEVDGYTDEVVAGEDGYSFTVTNNHIPAVTDVVVSKVWDDADNQDGIRPESIAVTLSGSDGSTYETELTAENGYSYLFSGLPVYYDHGTLITYTVKEIAVEGYETAYTVDESGYLFTITNTHEPETVSIPVSKVWDDNDDQDGIRPESITVTLNGSNGTAYTAELNAENDWTYLFEDVSVYWNKGEAVEYTLTEVTVDGYETEISLNEDDTGFILTNTHEPETTAVTVEKVWEDDGNRDGVRPESIHVVLTGTDGNTYEADLSAENNWKYVFADLPVYFNHGEQIVYSISEDVVENYETALEAGEDGYAFTLTNTHEIAVTDIYVEKTWDDEENQDGVRPSSIEVVLTGSDGSQYTAELTEESGWAYTFTDLSVYFNEGQTITYSLQERAVDGYSDEVLASEDGYSFTVTNNHIPAVTDVVISKVWDDADDQDGIRPDSIKVTMTGSDGNTYEAELTAENGYVCVFTGLPVYWNEGEQIVYTVEEEAVDGYESVVEKSESGYLFTITNSHTPETKNITVIKVWEDEDDKDGLRADVKLTLTGSDGSVYYGTILKDAADQSYTFTGLPVYVNGTEIVYTLSEDAISGYTATITEGDDNYVVVNSHTPEEEKKTPTVVPGETPKTGDESNVTLWIALAGCSLLGIVLCLAVFFQNRRRKRIR